MFVGEAEGAVRVGVGVPVAGGWVGDGVVVAVAVDEAVGVYVSEGRGVRVTVGVRLAGGVEVNVGVRVADGPGVKVRVGDGPGVSVAPHGLAKAILLPRSAHTGINGSGISEGQKRRGGVSTPTHK